MARRLWFVLPLLGMSCATVHSDTIGEDILPPAPGDAPRQLTIQNGTALPADSAPHAILITPNAPPRAIPQDQVDQLRAPPADVPQDQLDDEQAPPEQGTAAPMAPGTIQYAYAGGHPVPTAFGGGWCTIQGAHTHPYPPEEPELFVYNDNVWTFGVGSEWIYYDGHPIPGAWGGGWCDLPGKHYHGFRPWAGFNYDGGRRGFVYGAPATASGGVATRGSGWTGAAVGGPSLPAGTRAVTPVAVQPLKPGSGSPSAPPSGWPSGGSNVPSTVARSPSDAERLPGVVRLPSAPAAFPGVRIVRPTTEPSFAQRGMITPRMAGSSMYRPPGYAPRFAPSRAYGRGFAPRGYSSARGRPVYGRSFSGGGFRGGGFRGGGSRGGGRR